jgi:hypothetical protein
MNDFYSYFGLHPVSDDAEDVVMKLFSTTLHGNARKWYDNLPDASITTMEQLEETFLEKWGIQLEDISVLQKELEDIKQTENETLWDFQNRFEHALYQIPKGHRPEDKYIVHLYIHALLAHLGFPLSKRAPRTLYEAHDMATRIEQNISLSKIRYLFTSGTLSRESLFSLENFIVDFQEEGEQTIDQHRIVEDTVEELEPEQNDEISTCPPLSDEAIQEPISPAQQKDDEVSCFPFQDFDDTLFHDSENEGEMEALNEVDIPCCTIEDEGAVHEDETMTHVEDTQVLKAPAQEETISCPPLQDFDDFLLYDLGDEQEMDGPLNVLNPPCYDTDTDIVDFDEFIHVGRRKWDVVGFDMDPIYDIEKNFQVFPSQLSRQITFDFW